MSFSINKSFYLMALVALTAVTAIAPVYAAASDRAVDVALVMDSSGSMKKTDPKRLRVPAAKLLMTLLGDDDRIGVVSFSDDGYPIMRLTEATDANRELMFAAAEKVSDRGQYTNIYAGIKKGAEMLNSDPGEERRKIVVLMSDGKMDTGSKEKDAELVRLTSSELPVELKNQSIELYAIAFTEASDLRMMSDAAELNGGYFSLASNDKLLHEAFSRIFEAAKSPDMLPIEGGEFKVDSSVKEITIVASKSGLANEDITLELPTGHRVTEATAGESVRWFKSDMFDMITLLSPPVGVWKLLSTGGEDKAYIVTDLGIETSYNGEDIPLSARYNIDGWLTDSGQKVSQEDMLSSTDFYVTVGTQDGKEMKFGLDRKHGSDDASTFSGDILATDHGDSEIKITAKGKTFERAKSYRVNIKNPALATPVIEQQQTTVFQGGDGEKQAVPAVVAPPEDGIKEEQAASDPVDTAPISDGGDEGRSKEDEATSLPVFVAVFVGLNLLVAGIAGGFFYWKKRKSRKP